MRSTVGKVTLGAFLVLSTCMATTAAKALGEGTCFSYSYECMFENKCMDNGNGTFRCGCPEGTSGNGFKKEMGGGGCTGTCKSTSECPEFAVCDLTSLTIGVCKCKPGFTGDAIKGCTDINECALQGNPYRACDAHAVCMNSPGSYSCACLQHYRGDGFTCQWVCSSAADCAAGRSRCVRPGDYCECLSGFTGDGLTCNDIDECATDPNRCPTNNVCVNTIGSYTCKCKPGYALNPDTNLCVALARHCDERLSWDSKMKSGYFTVDFDFDGPVEPKQVYCDVRDGYAITEVQFGKGESFPREVPRAGGEDRAVDYGMGIDEIRKLVDNSPYCSQAVSVSCTSKYGSGTGTFSWKDGQSIARTFWGGSNIPGKCACGHLNACNKVTSGCNCGNGLDAVDEGILFDKTQLPVQSVTFPSSSAAAGYYDIGRLRCSSRLVDIPRTCHDVKFTLKKKTNLVFPIDPDGPGGVPPTLLYCDVETYRHTGVSRVPLTNPLISSTTINGEDIKYLVPVDVIKAVVDGAVFCSQRVEFRCRSTRSSGQVQVTSRSGPLSYFPGGSSDAPGSCGCGLSGSCTANSSVQCRCDVASALPTSDFGFILDKKDMPVLNIRSMAADGSQIVVGPLNCAEKQFGIEPNCEKYRQAGINNTDYGFFIDPDGPGTNNSAPFSAQCKIDDVQGITILRHDAPNGIVARGPFRLLIKYLRVTANQQALLISRSTYCTQKLTVSYSGSVNPANIQLKYFDGNSSSVLSAMQCTQSGTTCAYTTGTGTDSIVLTNMDQLPVTEVSASSSAYVGTAAVTINVGPLECSEIFSDCSKYLEFVKTKGVEGEVNIEKDLLLVDPDGAGDGKPMTVSCVYSDTYVDKPNATSYKIAQKPKSGPIGECFKLTYTDRAGNSISESQLAALVSHSRRCQQNLQIGSQGAPVAGFVRYRRCGATVNETTLASSLSSSWCECGIHGACDSGPTAQCNADIAPQYPLNYYQDSNTISETSRLPICEICMEMAAFPSTTTAGVPNKRLNFYVGQLKCGRGFGGPYNCQRYRQDPEFSTLKNRTLEYMWFDGEDKPVPVACIFDPYPPVGQIILQPLDSIFDTVQNVVTNKNIVYKSINITLLRAAINSSNYCVQIVYVFGASSFPQQVEPYGLFSLEQKIQFGISTRSLSADEIAGACQDARYTTLCSRWGPPTGLAVTNKGLIPITRVSLAATPRTITVAVNDATCACVEKDCEAIRQTGQSLPVDQNSYVMDPDQPGPSPPFQAECEFTRDQGITKIRVNDTVLQGTRGSAGTNQPLYFSLKNLYVNATSEQVHTLAQYSSFCWQGVKYVCSQAGLIGDNTSPEGRLAVYTGNASSFGTGYSTNAVGCACGLLGTCTTPDVSCNCDARGPMSADQGFITDPAAIPVTGFYKNIRSPDGRGQLSVTDVRCAPSPVDVPRDCVEAYSYGYKFGWNYTVSGEYLINPDNTSGLPFLVYCDFSNPSNPVTIIRPRQPRDRVPVKTTTTVEYPGPVSDAQLAALVRISGSCLQPLRVQCVGAKFITGGVRFAGVSDVLQSFWSSGSGSDATCTCGTLQRCGGKKSYSQQRATKCNCDIGDDEVRSDAAILSMKGALPVRRMIADITSGFLNLTVGALHCSPYPIEVNECEMGFHDCADVAQCVNLENGYDCVCPEGWKGLGRAANDLEAPAANGRQCIDDNECLPGNNLCPYNSDCVNTPGSFFCNCTDGYRNKDRRTCEDIDECAERTHDCDDHAKCTNTDGSYRCSCLMGYRGDGRRGNCLPVGQCTCFGDPHCLSFDRSWNHYQGLCEYTLADNDCGVSMGTIPRFRISSINWDRGFRVPGPFAFMRILRILLRGNEILLDQEGTITVNGRLRNNMWVELNDDQTETLTTVTRVGMSKVKLSTDFGMDLTWNGRDAVEILIPTSLMNKTCGLCGNYNGDDSDDWIVGPECPSLAGTVTNRQTLFGDSWTVNASEECKPDCNAPEPQPTCVSQYKADFMCDKLFNSSSPFAECLAKMSRKIREGLQYSCIYDLCHTNDTETTLCETAEAIANFCEEELAGDPVTWRSPTLCGEPTCSTNERFYICGPSEESTCNNPEPTYFPLCREGCVCVEGFKRQGAECLPEARCGCTYGEDLMKIGSQQVLNNCSLLVTCVAHEDHSEEVYSCNPNQVCAITDGIEACVCAEGTTKDSTTGQCLSEDYCLGGGGACSSKSVCVSTRTSFFCNCSNGYRNIDRLTCEDIDECAEGISNCGQNAECRNSDGSYACVCKDGYTSTGEEGSCNDIDECAEGSSNCGQNAECRNSDGSYQCVCKDGYTSTGEEGSCNDIDECAEGIINCGQNSECRNSDGSYGCVCKDGYTAYGEEGTCNDIDECVEGISNCSQNAECRNSDGSYECVCKDGYTAYGEEGTCNDIDECAEGIINCVQNAECRNSEGSYRCVCKDGYTAYGEECKDIDECAEGSSNCGQNAECRNNDGSYECVCKDGYTSTGEEGSCSDIDECAEGSSNCGQNAECRNSDGSYECVCKDGYTSTGEEGTCNDIDECAEGSSNCGQNAECRNSDGSYECVCKDGYTSTGEEGTCNDIDECAEGSSNCGQNAECRNSDGSYECVCKDGYTSTGEEGTCNDIDECAEGSSNCGQNAECRNSDGSYVCVCKDGYTSTGEEGTCNDIDECAEGSSNCGQNAECRNSDGSYVCVCKDGYTSTGEEGSCNDIDECAEVSNNCGQNAECRNNDGSYECVCKDGYTSTGEEGTCNDIDECAEGSSNCGQNAECRNSDGSYQCVCKDGYTSTREEGSCSDIDECAEGSSNCGQNAECRNNDGSYQCVCKDGYTSTGEEGSCSDIDECAEGSSNCSQNAECRNSDGIYMCVCKDGYTSTGEEGSCNDIDECAEGSSNCGQNAECRNNDGSYDCVCKDGYTSTGEEGSCSDIDECAEGSSNCGQNAECRNNDGSYVCVCKDGYTSTGEEGSCSDIDECAEGSSNCSQNAECRNSDGIYMCVCKDGYTSTGEEGSCNDIDECAEGSSNCSQNAECRNNDGSYVCVCKDGYTSTGEEGSCNDIDECAEGNSNCGQNAECRNSDGSYECVCKDGYTSTGEEGSCNDIDECAEGISNCDEDAECRNSDGSYECVCKDGYTSTGEEGSCNDIDECAEGNSNCGQNAECRNSDGSYECVCKDGYTSTGEEGSCNDIDECTDGSNDCDEYATCTNLNGSYECTCVDGYLGDGSAGNCQQDRDCLPENNPCPPSSECVNTRESFYCRCSDGYRQVDSVTCEDVDECADGNNDCDVNAVCENIAGSFECACVDGYLGNGKAGSCTRDDDCSPENNRCPTYSICHNTPDSFYCNCSEGYRNVDSVTCTDIDECAEGSHNCDVNAECTNQDGSFQCACLEGYIGDGKIDTCIKPDLCVDVECAAPNTECRNGLCVCRPGFELDCEKCEDIDECATGENSCGHLGQVCVNTPGSYRCECVDGFRAEGGYCHDINECEDGSAVCGAHSECKNLLGTYACRCCMGYTKREDACRRDKSLDAVYGAPGEECCACTGGDCEDPNPVCASNGQTYPNYASMVVAGCRDNVTLDVSYRGYCESSCSGVVCSRPYQTCVETARGALCLCPSCDSEDSENRTPVCGSNGHLYPSECIFQMIVCSMGTPGVTLRPLEYCSEQRPDSESSLGPWSPWNDCSPTCGKGYTSRSRSGQTGETVTQRAVCYTPCQNGPCEEDSCHNPGQVCEVGSSGEAVCTCPDCSGRPEEPVCGLLGDLVKTFENECQLRRTACQLTKPFRVLEDRACEDKPPTCTKTSYTPEVLEGDCVAKLPEDLGFCYGKCGQNPAWCCRPEASETVSLTITFDCQDGSSRSEQRDFVKINWCGCTQEPQRRSDIATPVPEG